MKKLLFILILFLPALLFAQQDSTKRTFKIQKPTTYALINGISLGSITKGALLRAKTITVTGPTDYKINGFTMSMQYKWSNTCDSSASPGPFQSTNADLTQEMLKAISTVSNNAAPCVYSATIRFYNIQYVLPDGSMPKLNDILLLVTGN